MERAGAGGLDDLTQGGAFVVAEVVYLSFRRKRALRTWDSICEGQRPQSRPPSPQGAYDPAVRSFVVREWRTGQDETANWYISLRLSTYSARD